MSVLPRQLPPLSLYVHIPWCEKKCPYCDFNSHVDVGNLPEAEYVQALIQDMRSQKFLAQGRVLESIFFGGGTPSLFSAEAIARIIQAAKEHFGFSENIEITLEANPGSSEHKKFAGFAKAGVNRISLGVQSFDNTKLERLGRIHNHDDIYTAVDAIKQAGISRFNIDLMHGLPEQTPAQALHDLQHAIDLGAKHISWYQLTIEQNTQFFRFPPILPVEDDLADIQDQGFELLAKHGFSQYEISAFATETSERSRHNLNYWQFGDYLAIGAGAHGKVTLVDELAIQRFNNTRLPKDYLARIDNYVAQREEIMPEDALFEALMNGLRLNDGVDKHSLLSACLASESQLDAVLAPFVKKGLLENGEKVKATAQGLKYLNFILEGLLDND